jgi:hypothetical protein
MLRCRRRDASQALPTVPWKQFRVVLRLPLLMRDGWLLIRRSRRPLNFTVWGQYATIEPPLTSKAPAVALFTLVPVYSARVGPIVAADPATGGRARQRGRCRLRDGRSER